MPNTAFARFLHFNYEDDAADILQELPKKTPDRDSGKMKDDKKKKKIEKLLNYDSQTAGGLMDLNFIVIEMMQVSRKWQKKPGNISNKEGIAPTVVCEERERWNLGIPSL